MITKAQWLINKQIILFQQQMEYLARRENDPEYLKTVIAQKNIVIEEEKRINQESQKDQLHIQTQYQSLLALKLKEKETSTAEIFNLTLAIKQLQSDHQTLKYQKSQLEFELNNAKIKIQEASREHLKTIDKIKNDFEAQKDGLNIKIFSLQKTISDLKRYYRIDEGIQEDKKKIIEDSNRDLKGFSNEKQERILIIQNEQYKNQIEFQSKNITIQLHRIEKLQEELKGLKLQVELHKQIQSDLVKRSSLAQTLIKKMSRELQDLKMKSNSDSLSNDGSSMRRSSDNSEEQSSRVSQATNKQLNETINKLKFENANLQNFNRYLENMQNLHSRKYQTLGSIMAEYLQNLLYFKDKANSESDLEGTSNSLQINLASLKNKDIKEWKGEELEAILTLLIAQIKPFLSKNSLIQFPEVKNINISFVEETSKEALSLPRLVENYEKSHDKDVKKGGNNRFKDIPIDISTKILRSNLREWGVKIKYGNNPMNKKQKSKSNAEDIDHSVL